MREKRWVHYPQATEANIERDSFKDAEAVLLKSERERRLARRKRVLEQPIYLDLDQEESLQRPVDAPLGIKQREPLGHLVAGGGLGGLGNPHFTTTDNRSPKFATRGQEGERITLSLELKLLADVGLVGMPNAGKSTLLRALTGGRAKSEIAGYAFTTLNPIVGIVRVAEDGTFEGSVTGQSIHDETWKEEQIERERLESGAYANALTRNQTLGSQDDISQTRIRHGHHFDLFESFRFTIADNPGLISRASENVGLGHAFLRSMERSLALVYVVDLSGMSSKARMVVANKADLLAGDEDPAAVEEAKDKLKRLEEFVEAEMVLPDGRKLSVIPTSAKFSQNLNKVVTLMQEYVEEARTQLEKQTS